MEKLDFTFTGNLENAPAMVHYMKDRFVFLGVKSPDRRAQSKPLLQASRQVDLATIHT